MRVLLVGESTPLLRIVSVVSARAGHNVEVADSVQTLRGLMSQPPDLLVFDHVHPLDLVVFNPRSLGFGGPVLVLTESHDQEVVALRLKPERVLRKPFHLDELLRQLNELARTLNERRSQEAQARRASEEGLAGGRTAG